MLKMLFILKKERERERWYFVGVNWMYREVGLWGLRCCLYYFLWNIIVCIIDKYVGLYEEIDFGYWLIEVIEFIIINVFVLIWLKFIFF